MLYICIPSYNEAPTVGVLLWRIRKVFQEFSREYEVLVYDDGSTDATAETLAPYRDVMPLTVLGGPERKGYAAAVDALCRAVAKRTRYPRRDAAIFLQGDFTDQPEHIPELVKRFEGGADVVVAERPKAPEAAAALPLPVQRLGRVAPWVLKPFVRVPGVRDPFGSYRLYRIAVLRDVVRTAGARAVVVGDVAAPSWGANAELLMNVAAFARRVESVELAPRYDVRPRATRIRPLADALGLFRVARAARSRRLVPGAAAAAGSAGSARDTAGESAATGEVDEAPRAVAAEGRAGSGRPAAKGAATPAKGAAAGRGGGEAGTEQRPVESGDAGATTTERRRSRRNRKDRAGRSSAAAAPGEATTREPNEDSPPPPPRRRGSGRKEKAESVAERAGAIETPDTLDTPETLGARDTTDTSDATRATASEAGVDSPAPEGTAGGEAGPEGDAQRQRQRARRKRSRQRRAAAAREGSRDGSRDQSSNGDADDASATHSAPPPVEPSTASSGADPVTTSATSPAASPAVQ